MGLEKKVSLRDFIPAIVGIFIFFGISDAFCEVLARYECVIGKLNVRAANSLSSIPGEKEIAKRGGVAFSKVSLLGAANGGDIIAPASEVKEACEDFVSSYSNVLYVEPNYQYQASLTPDDT
ncbi:MAG: hypothetical protein D6808_05315, partial [Candidatus Dadabacteria bacterium]